MASAGIHLGALVNDDQATLRIMERLPVPVDVAFADVAVPN
jgi:hypothetical protein